MQKAQNLRLIFSSILPRADLVWIPCISFSFLISPRTAMWFRMIICLCASSVANVSAQSFLREGFSSQLSSDARNEMRLEENESANGMTREMFLMKEISWELHPTDFSAIKDSRLRRHVESFFHRPVLLKLSPRKGKYGLRAMGQAPSGKRLRGFWRQAGGVPSKSGDFLSASYDDAVRTRLSMMELEVQLPPVNKRTRALPSIIYSFAVEPGSLNAKAIVPRGAGQVRVLPNGHSPMSKDEAVIVGKAHVSLPMRSGIIDPSWAKGRSVFRRGRPVGFV